MTGARYPAHEVHGLSEAGRPMLVRYDLERLHSTLDRDAIAARSGGFWRRHELRWCAASVIACALARS